ncbi:hypothetical protein AVEN_200901-1 [Araneus ventricosus]|uniref:Uncharacterized protein n=1 Tax=Araneus ventricosus TaxID=182803 RepID=A0A4Y2R1W1_ARAVE|nr:hypothetical protein AVEN_56098-1 [Araneus ventricosus]GBN69342.1 hypothetical protein AVEN_200901-1 [Araneus ventricosus]
MPSLFTFRVKQPPEIGAMAKITLLHRVAYEKATPSSGLTSLGMKIRNRHVESCVYKNVLELRSSWNTNRAHLPNWTSCGHTNIFCILLWSAKFGQTACRTFSNCLRSCCRTLDIILLLGLKYSIKIV